MKAVIEDIAIALTRVVASADDDPYGESGDVLITREMFDLLRDAHAALHHLRRSKRNVGRDLSWITLQKEVMREALVRTNGKKCAAADLLGINAATLYRWRKDHGID